MTLPHSRSERLWPRGPTTIMSLAAVDGELDERIGWLAADDLPSNRCLSDHPVRATGRRGRWSRTQVDKRPRRGSAGGAMIGR